MRSRRRRRLSPCSRAKSGDADAEAILSFQIALLEDDNLAAPAFALIAGGEVANRAWSAAIDPEIASYEQANDPYFRARASDLRDLRDRVLRHLAGEADQTVPAGVIVAAPACYCSILSEKLSDANRARILGLLMGAFQVFAFEFSPLLGQPVASTILSSCWRFTAS